jgi:hypothetical protein
MVLLRKIRKASLNLNMAWFVAFGVPSCKRFCPSDKAAIPAVNFSMSCALADRQTGMRSANVAATIKHSSREHRLHDNHPSAKWQFMDNTALKLLAFSDFIRILIMVS